jgi:DNA-3-methyladenine glycosylase I
MSSDNGLVVGEDGQARCFWAGSTPIYTRYHDHEWATPTTDDRTLFEKVCLEGFQSGLSWLTILNKRDNFRLAFDNFEVDVVVKYGDADVERLVLDAGIVRHRQKIRSVINNAQRAIELRSEFGSLAAYFWSFEPPPEARPDTLDVQTLRTLAKTDTSTRLSKDLKRRGWSFVGPTTAYAFMQAMGMVNDHIEGCHRRDVVEQARAGLTRPS